VTRPRFLTHPSGLWAVQHTDSADWHLYDPDGRLLGSLQDGQYHTGWVEAALIALPESDATSCACGCGQRPDGAPGWEGCSAGCMEPAFVQFGNRFGNRVILDVRDGTVRDGAGEDLSREAAERRGAALIAAARWGTTGGET
jgi:hypothetical protein